jgi:hypothetical protein
MPNRKRIPPATCRRALELLAASRDGCTEAIMLAHGFTIPQMVELVRAGLVRARTERVHAGGLRMLRIGANVDNPTEVRLRFGARYR